MLVTLQVLNIIIAYRLFTAYCSMPSVSYCHQITNKFKKLLDQKGKGNTLIIITLIFLVFCVDIRPTKLLEKDTPNAEFDVDERFCPGFTYLD